MGDDGEVFFFGGQILQMLDHRLSEFNNRPAFNANEMIMVGRVFDFIAAEFIVEPVLFNETFFFENMESPVDCGQPDSGIFFSDQKVKLFRTDMFSALKQSAGDHQPLGGDLDTGIPEPVCQAGFV